MICAIVLPAARSERVGTQNLLRQFEGKPVPTRSVDELRISPVYEVIVGVGRDGKRIQPALEDRGMIAPAQGNHRRHSSNAGNPPAKVMKTPRHAEVTQIFWPELT